MSFEKDLEKFTKNVEEGANKVFRGSAIEIFSKIIKRTPVGNPSIWLYKHPQKGYVDYLSYKDAPAGYVGGRLRGNWQVGINFAPITVVNNTDKSGASTRREGNATINKAKITQAIYIMNNLPYAEAIEEGWSSQAPAGMVRVTVAEWKYTVNRLAAKNAQQAKFGKTL